jgi:hypothetical protein
VRSSVYSVGSSNQSKLLRPTFRNPLDKAPGLQIQLDRRNVPWDRALKLAFQSLLRILRQIRKGDLSVSTYGLQNCFPDDVIFLLVDVNTAFS